MSSSIISRIAADATVECRTCKSTLDVHSVYRCADCHMALCKECIRDHFGSNRHQPHPAHQHQWDALLKAAETAVYSSLTVRKARDFAHFKRPVVVGQCEPWQSLLDAIRTIKGEVPA